MASARKTKAEADQAKDEASLKLLVARDKGHRDGVIEGLASAIRILLTAGDEDAAERVRGELVRRFPSINVGALSGNIDRDMLNEIYRGNSG